MGKKIFNKRKIRERYQRKIDQPQDSDQSVYLDRRGYYRYRSNNKLVHRVVAYNIWHSNRQKYPLPFESYVVHHKDGVMTNNRPRNLELLTVNDHNNLHPHLLTGKYPDSIPSNASEK